MHTVAASYMGAFAIADPSRRTPAVWRFGRDGSVKCLGIYDTEVVRDIYAVTLEDGSLDTGIEDELLQQIDHKFCGVRDLLRSRGQLTVQQFSALDEFVSMQLLRTPRSLQMIRSFISDINEPAGPDTPQRVMLGLAPRFARRMARMRHVVGYNESDFAFLTSDNPATTWRKVGDQYEYGIDLRNPEVVVSCPLAPDLIYHAYQTPESFRVNLNADAGQPTPGDYKINIDFGVVPTVEVKRLNGVCVEGAHRHVYSQSADGPIRAFVERRFAAHDGPHERRSF